VNRSSDARKLEIISDEVLNIEMQSIDHGYKIKDISKGMDVKGNKDDITCRDFLIGKPSDVRHRQSTPGELTLKNKEHDQAYMENFSNDNFADRFNEEMEEDTRPIGF
jgi:hypothetical protein